MVTIKSLTAELKKAETSKNVDEVKKLKAQIKSMREENARKKAENDKKKNQSKKKKSIYDSEYGKNVLLVNKALKEYEKTYEGALNRLFSVKDKVKMSKRHNLILTTAKKGGKNATFKMLKGYVNPHKKSGTYSPFYVLRAIQKHVDKLEKTCK